ncbi:hypothetical protein SDC9_25114 [bioreactor metagenome]|uniref:Uncharacterized protein n=1 Tax=bioreactor metagenome TaxID=1076179 RepID=A0A644UJP9_9ZZZZ
MRDAFALPPASPKTAKTLTAAVAYIQERMTRQADTRDIINGLVQYHSAKLTYPSYRTALRCGGICTEAASCCPLRTAKLLLSCFVEKAGRYLEASSDGDLFARAALREMLAEGRA